MEQKIEQARIHLLDIQRQLSDHSRFTELVQMEKDAKQQLEKWLGIKKSITP